MPLAYGTLAGRSDHPDRDTAKSAGQCALRENGLAAFGLFSFTPVGMTAMLAGIGFVALLGRFFLPRSDPAKESVAAIDLGQEYALERSILCHASAAGVAAGRHPSG